MSAATEAAVPDPRHVELDPGLPLELHPAEAIEAMLDRGSLSDWRRVAAEIRRDPWGRVARIVETITSWDEHSGVDALMREVIVRASEQVDRSGRERYAAQIRAWRARTGLSQREFARAAGTSAPRLSDYERAKVAPTTDVLARLEHVAASRSERR
ncbi:MAG: helix-turn-helix domain-containing protein [Solirubrobacteraceae bacterium]